METYAAGVVIDRSMASPRIVARPLSSGLSASPRATTTTTKKKKLGKGAQNRVFFAWIGKTCHVPNTKTKFQQRLPFLQCDNMISVRR